jgi:hypothetical protein
MKTKRSKFKVALNRVMLFIPFMILINLFGFVIITNNRDLSEADRLRKVWCWILEKTELPEN